MVEEQAQRDESSAQSSASETWVPPVEIVDYGIPAFPIPDIGRDRRWRQWRSEQSGDLTDWRLWLEDTIRWHRTLRNILLIMLLLTTGVMGALWGVGLKTTTLWMTPYDPLTRPVFWVVAVVAIALLASTIWCQLQLHALKRRLRFARAIGA